MENQTNSHDITSIESDSAKEAEVATENLTENPAANSTASSTAAANAPDTSRNGIKALAVLALMVGMLSVLGVVSFALFTDSETIASNTFSSGGIDLTVSSGASLVTLATPPMAPGDQYTAPLTVGNGGTIELRYSMTSTTTEDVLAGELVMTIKSGVTTCDNANWAATGTSVYSGVLGTVATSNIFGSSAQGADTGDRTIAGGADETLCFNVTLPLAATNASQGITSTATFTLDAEQTDNNA